MEQIGLSLEQFKSSFQGETVSNVELDLHPNGGASGLIKFYIGDKILYVNHESLFTTQK